MDNILVVSSKKRDLFLPPSFPLPTGWDTHMVVCPPVPHGQRQLLKKRGVKTGVAPHIFSEQSYHTSSEFDLRQKLDFRIFMVCTINAFFPFILLSLVYLFLKTALLRYNRYTINFTYLNVQFYNH